MNTIILVAILVIFLCINGIIIISDIRHKKIPNKHLLILLAVLPFFYAHLYTTDNSFPGISFFSLQISISILVSFFLYYYSIWSAGDAKYLLILSLYLTTIGVIPFIGNLAIITIVYLFGYYVYFYGKLIFSGAEYRNSLFANIFTDQRDRFKLFLSKNNADVTEKKRAIQSMLKIVLIFLVFFVSIRLSRSYIIEDLTSIQSIHIYALQYPTYFVFLLLGVFLLFFLFIRKILTKSKAWLEAVVAKKRYVPDIELIFIFLLLFLLVCFLGYEYWMNPQEIMHKLFLIFTLYLACFFVFKILIYSYKITFQLGEQEIIPISRLQSGDIVDKDYLLALFGTQDSLGYSAGFNKNAGLFSPSPREYIENMDNPIDEPHLRTIKKAYSVVNDYHKKNKTSGFQKIGTVKVLKTFPFGIYIFAGFIVTYIWEDTLLRFLVENFLSIITMIR